MIGDGFERADPCPTRFTAVTTTRSLCPTTPAPSRYFDRFAPRSRTHDPPARLQDCHAYRNAVGRFDHLPRWAESVFPSRTAPAIFGAARLWGARSLPATEVAAESNGAASRSATRSTPKIETDRFIEGNSSR